MISLNSSGGVTASADGDHHQGDEDHDQRPVRPGEREDAADHALGQLVLGDVGVLAPSGASGRRRLRASSTCVPPARVQRWPDRGLFRRRRPRQLRVRDDRAPDGSGALAFGRRACWCGLLARDLCPGVPLAAAFGASAASWPRPSWPSPLFGRPSSWRPAAVLAAAFFAVVFAGRLGGGLAGRRPWRSSCAGRLLGRRLGLAFLAALGRRLRRRAVLGRTPSWPATPSWPCALAAAVRRLPRRRAAFFAPRVAPPRPRKATPASFSTPCTKPYDRPASSAILRMLSPARVPLRVLGGQRPPLRPRDP